MGNERVAILIKDIQLIESAYSKSVVYYKGESYVQTYTSKHFEDDLNSFDIFFRAHKHWLINRLYLNTWTDDFEHATMTNGTTIDISRRNKNSFKDFCLNSKYKF